MDGRRQSGSLRAQPGGLIVTPASDRLVLLSPPDLVIRSRNAHALVLGVEAGAMRRIEVWGEAVPGSGWVRMGESDAGAWTVHAAGVEVPLRWPREWREDAIAERIRIVVIATDPEPCAGRRSNRTDGGCRSTKHRSEMASPLRFVPITTALRLDLLSSRLPARPALLTRGRISTFSTP